MREWRDILYARQNPLKQAINIFAPDEGKPVVGAVIWFHGGGIESGRRVDNEFLVCPLVERGIAVALCSYRLMPEDQYPSFLEDAALASAAAHRRFREMGHFPIIIGGSSAGAYLTMMLCFDRRWLALGHLTPEDFDGYLFDAGQPTTHFNVLKYRGEDERLVIIDDTAPLYHVRDARPMKPVTILVADNDMPSRRTQNILLVETMKRFGYPEELIEMETMAGCTHCSYDGSRDADGHYILENRIAQLLDRCRV